MAPPTLKSAETVTKKCYREQLDKMVISPSTSHTEFKGEFSFTVALELQFILNYTFPVNNASASLRVTTGATRGTW